MARFRRKADPVESSAALVESPAPGMQIAHGFTSTFELVLDPGTYATMLRCLEQVRDAQHAAWEKSQRPADIIGVDEAIRQLREAREPQMGSSSKRVVVAELRFATFRACLRRCALYDDEIAALAEKAEQAWRCPHPGHPEVLCSHGVGRPIRRDVSFPFAARSPARLLGDAPRSWRGW